MDEMKLRKIGHAGNLYAHWCPGCEEVHVIPVPRWTFNGNEAAPTFTPSVNYIGFCHYNLTDGKLIFHADCNHGMKGRTVDLPEFPQGE
jgi:hypothetical protein